MLIDHLVYAVPVLDDAVAELERRVGVRAEGGGKHVGVGTHNALLGLDERTYLEVIAPDPDQPTPAGPRPFGVDDATSPRLAGWAIARDDIDAAIAAARAAGFDPGDATDMSRARPDGTRLQWRLTRPADGGPVPFLIAWGDTQHPARTAPAGLSLEAFEIEHPNPVELLTVLDALDVTVPVKRADTIALVARIRGPRGVVELR